MGGILHIQPDVPLVTVTGEAVEVQTAEFFGTGRSDVEVVPMEAPFDTRKAEVAVVDADKSRSPASSAGAARKQMTRLSMMVVSRLHGIGI